VVNIMITNANRKAAGATNTNGLYKITDSTNFRSHGSLNQALAWALAWALTVTTASRLGANHE